MAEERTVSPVIVRPPTSAERRAAVALAKDIRKVTFPGKAPKRTMSVDPPGAIRTKGLVRQEIQGAMGQPRTARAFRRTENTRTIHTPISVGIMCDISGSMATAQEPLAVARWVLADALHQVQGTVATVLFGNYGHPIQAPRETVRNIEIYDANGGHENFRDGFSLLDAAVDLIDGHGARLLVIITDGHFVLPDARVYAEQVMDMARAADVAVVWLQITDYFARSDAYGHGQVVDVYGKSAVQVAERLGDAVVDEFRRVAPRNVVA